MTICVSVKVAEGLVFAADSASSMMVTVPNADGSMQQAVVQTFEHANKVSHVGEYPIAMMSWGLGSIKDRSIQSLVMEYEYSHELKKKFKVSEIADDITKFIQAKYDEAYPKDKDTPERPGLGMLIGGYSHREFFAEIYEYEFHGDETISRERQPAAPDGSPSFGCDWFGMVDPLTRLMRGHCNGLSSRLADRGVAEDILQEVLSSEDLKWPVVFAGMPLQDAIDFAEFSTQLVIGAYRFGIGPPVCGGAIDVAVLRPERFEWARRKQWAIKE